MTLEEFVKLLENSDRLRILKDEKEVFVGFLALFTMVDRPEETDTMFNQYKGEEVKKFRAIPEIRHKRWKELNLMKPLEPDETPEFSFSDLKMNLYYTIYI